MGGEVTINLTIREAEYKDLIINFINHAHEETKNPETEGDVYSLPFTSTGAYKSNVKEIKKRIKEAIGYPED